MRVADWLMNAVAAAGVDHVFLLPGGGAMHLNDALAQCKALSWVACHHEQSCGIAAEAYGRIAGKLGVALVTTGPGATNILTPVAGAWIESSPLLIVSGQVKRSDLLKNAPLRQKGVQEVDIVPMVASITKYAVTVEDPESIRWHFEKAVRLATTGRKGPVWLDIPLDVQAAPIYPTRLRPYIPEDESNPPMDASLAPIAALLASAERPLILAGHGVRLAGAAEQLRQFAERYEIPVALAWNALDFLPWSHPLNAGRPGVVALRGANFAVQRCDVLISIGCRLDNVVTAYAPGNFARNAKRVLVDIDPNELAKLAIETEARVVADAGDFLTVLTAAMDRSETSAPDRNPWLKRIADWKTRYPMASANTERQPATITHAAFVDAVSEVLPPDTVVATGSSGLAVEFFYTGFRNKESQRVFLTSGLGAMGYGLPAAIGACLAAGRRPMVLVESDGSLMLNLQELATLKALDLPIAIILMNNAGYASIRNTQRNYFEGRHIGTGAESGLWLPDFAAVAADFGLASTTITDPAALEIALRQGLDLPRPCLIDVHLQANEILAPKVSAMPQSDGSIVSMPLEDMTPLLSFEELAENLDGDVAAVSATIRRI
jgi:acetolactate synthase-1/2/3 large subunit